MAQFLNTRKGAAAIEELIKGTGETLILISPYLRLSKDFKELLNLRNEEEKKTTIIFGKQELKPDEMKFLESLRFVILKYNENLHAKCYLNEEKMIITSLNLYEFSMAHNKEMGILIEKNNSEDKKLYEDALQEVEYIQKTSQNFSLNVKDSKVHSKKSKNNQNANGYCIRCGSEIKLNTEHPLCKKCYNSWSKYADPTYEEKFCHICGKNNKSTMEKPVCYSCYKKSNKKN